MTLAARLTERIAVLTGGRAQIDPVAVLDRSPWLALAPPSRVSPNGSCRLIRAADAWVAINLPRIEDRELLPAWIGVEADIDEAELDRAIAARQSSELVERAVLLGLAVARVGETEGRPPLIAAGAPRDRPARRVVDLSTLWAGPLCAGVLAAAGLDVIKIESDSRPDPVRVSAPGFDAELNGGKQRRALDFSDSAALFDRIADADILVTSARPRAFEALGIAPEIVRRRNPDLTWIAITAHGWTGPGAMRIGFGDDCAAAGNLVEWSDGEPRFRGDALADPLTGLTAAIAALETLHLGGVTIDVALAQTAGGFA